MALLRKSLAQRFFVLSKINNPSITNCRNSLPRAFVFNRQTSPDDVAPDPGDDGVFRRYLHRPPEAETLGFIPTGGRLLEKLREMDISRDRIRLDGLRPPPASEEFPDGKVAVADVKKALRLLQLEKLKSRLRQIGKASVCYSDFFEICVKESSSVNQAVEFSKMLDDSGSVVIFGNTVFLRPEQVVKAIQELIPAPSSSTHSDPNMTELQEMEEQMAAIDRKAVKQVKLELWSGLSYLVIQTAAFMRLTFWELSWDVMEPICFFTGSIYFMGCYAFFLRTSKEPCFEGFFHSRFSAKRARLIKNRDFDIRRYNELKKGCCTQAQVSEVAASPS